MIPWQRVISALVLIPGVVFLLWWHPLAFTVLILAVATLMLYEFHQLARPKGGRFPLLLFIPLSLLIGLPETCPFGLGATLFFAALQPVSRRRAEGCFHDIAFWHFGALYIGYAFAYHLILLRRAPYGVPIILFLAGTIWLTDTFAYTFGRWLGRRPLMPSISPKKTVEGAIGGTLGGTLTGMSIWFLGLRELLPWYHSLTLSLAMSLIGQTGDLIESALKRDAGVKDSGRLIPGHGGMLDRCDSLIFTAPAMYYYMKLVVGS